MISTAALSPTALTPAQCTDGLAHGGNPVAHVRQLCLQRRRRLWQRRPNGLGGLGNPVADGLRGFGAAALDRVAALGAPGRTRRLELAVVGRRGAVGPLEQDEQVALQHAQVDVLASAQPGPLLQSVQLMTEERYVSNAGHSMDEC